MLLEEEAAAVDLLPVHHDHGVEVHQAFLDVGSHTLASFGFVKMSRRSAWGTANHEGRFLRVDDLCRFVSMLFQTEVPWTTVMAQSAKIKGAKAFHI